MSVREIVDIGDPVLRKPAREVDPDELRTARVQALIDDLIETRRAANGAGLAAVQIGEPLRIAVAENDGANPRYPYKPPIPLTVMVNPALEPADPETVLINEGCLSVPDLRGDLERHVAVRVRYLDREGNEHHEVVRGLTAGTFQHEVDHLNGVLFVDRANPRSLATWEQFERHRREEFVARAEALVARVGS
jgi:peptide deformylase